MVRPPRWAIAMLAAAACITAGCTGHPTARISTAADTPNKPASSIEVLPVEEVTWEALNPARGDRSPQAGTLWGDRDGAVPTGFLARFVDGFSSPPHIHNATYRAVVINRLVHNEHPLALKRWMPPGSFWTQPKGQVHITAAQGENTTALVEIDEGPYLVKPSADRFEVQERPMNVDASNVVWVSPAGMESSDSGVRQAFLWGSTKEGQANGTFLKLPPRFEGTINSRATTFRAVVIRGAVSHNHSKLKELQSGSYFGSTGDTLHPLSAQGKMEAVLYIRTDGPYDVSRGKRP